MVGKSNNNKKIILILVVLVLLVVALVVGVIVANVMQRNDDIDFYELTEREKMINLANEDCNSIQDIYDSGAITMTRADAMYEKKMEGYDDNYKIYLTICYVDNMRYYRDDFDETINLLKQVEPLLTEDYDFIEYYDRLVVYYVEKDDQNMVDYYASKRDSYMTVFNMEEGEVSDEMDE